MKIMNIMEFVMKNALMVLILMNIIKNALMLVVLLIYINIMKKKMVFINAQKVVLLENIIH